MGGHRRVGCGMTRTAPLEPFNKLGTIAALAGFHRSEIRHVDLVAVDGDPVCWFLEVWVKPGPGYQERLRAVCFAARKAPGVQRVIPTLAGVRADEEHRATNVILFYLRKQAGENP